MKDTEAPFHIVFSADPLSLKRDFHGGRERARERVHVFATHLPSSQ